MYEKIKLDIVTVNNKYYVDFTTIEFRNIFGEGEFDHVVRYICYAWHPQLKEWVEIDRWGSNNVTSIDLIKVDAVIRAFEKQFWKG